MIGSHAGYVHGRGHGVRPASSRGRTTYNATSVAYAQNLHAQMIAMHNQHKKLLNKFVKKMMPVLKRWRKRK